MKRSEKIEFLKGIMEDKANPLDLLSYIIIICDPDKPDEQREYSLFVDGLSFPISRAAYDRIKAPIVVLDQDDINL